ncbi:hypothetical protein [Streptomyces phaeochromogenes]
MTVAVLEGIEGIAGFVPPRTVANDDLPVAWGVDDAWVRRRRRSGIGERRWAAPGVATGLGLGGAAAWDVSAACSGFGYRSR